MSKRTCSIDGCHKTVHCRDWCVNHYRLWGRNGVPAKLSPVTDEDRFWAKVRKTPSGCWIWIGKTRTGYGRFYIQKVGPHSRYVDAHRYSYEMVNGPIPEGLYLDHLCRNPPCVNPAHLEAVTPRENWIRGVAPNAQAHLFGECFKGHSMSGHNLLVHTDSKGVTRRQCRMCRDETSRRRHSAKRTQRNY